MNILLLTSSLPYPLDHGSRIRSHFFIRELSKHHEITLLSIVRSKKEADDARELNPYCRQITTVLLPSTTFRKFINFLKSFLHSLPYTVLANTDDKVSAEFLRLLRSKKFDAVHIEELYGAENVSKELSLPVIVGAHNIESLILRRLSLISRNPLKKLFYAHQAWTMKRFEQDWARSAKAVIVVSEKEAQYYRKTNHQILLAPNGVPDVHVVTKQKKDILLFTGSLRYPPNRDGLLFFCTDIWPELSQKNPRLSLYVVARDVPRSLLHFASERISFHQNVDDIEPYFAQSDVLIAPLRSGGGTRLKILQAFSRGLPVVSTSIGAEGIEAEDGKHLLIANTVYDFQCAVEKLLNDREFADTLAVNAATLAREKYLWSSIVEEILPDYESICTPRVLRPLRILVVIPHDTLLSPQGSRERLNGLLQLLSEHEFHFLVPSSMNSTNLSDLPSRNIHFFHEPSFLGFRIPYFLDDSRKFARIFRETIQREQIDLAFFHFPWGLSRAATTTSIPLVYFSHGIEADFTKITVKHLGLDFLILRSIFRALIERRERANCQKSSCILAMSKADKNQYEKRYQISSEKIFTLNQPVKIWKSTSSRQEVCARYGLDASKMHIVFHGSYAHLPNREALRSLEEIIAPALEAPCPNVRFVVVGPGMPVFQEKNIIALGFIDNLLEFLGAMDIAVVPIFQGAGVRMKIYDYFKTGVPVVTTQTGIEGIEVENLLQAFVVEDNAHAIIGALCTLAADSSLRQQLRFGATEFLAKNYSFDGAKKIIHKLVEGLFESGKTLTDRDRKVVSLSDSREPHRLEHARADREKRSQ